MEDVLLGLDMFGEQIHVGGPLARRFTIPPFSVLDGRSGEWQTRKSLWLSLGIESELGRSAPAISTIHERMEEERYGGKRRAKGDGTSIFDPVLCELIYRWFAAPGAQVIDPFAGGSVRGIVAAYMGLKYWGCDLSEAQIVANEAQRARILQNEHNPKYLIGDATDMLTVAPDADLIFTCPPYADLERYSDDPRDLSTMTYPQFLLAYRKIIKAAASRLRWRRFACFVVGDVRDKKTGHYYGFVADTIRACREAGLALYNDAIYITPAGSLPVRVSATFDKSRKLGKTHQNVLVFVRGDAPTLPGMEQE